ncbi:class I SAM-dependent methyltransferase [Primorskyibacter sp. S187A]|uniref:class I SAM-dependent methyltransferase n=1 Tax=Primorskyibacter sp. S187A TaxID=3415130 RepID=UPI003C7A10FB
MSLAQVIAERIAQDGPITVADFMALCLQHPEYGYYITRDPLGADFITAPEISQMFGELIGLSLAQAWLDQGAPSRFTLAELGPGRGTLMADMLRAAERVPGFIEAADVVLLETSPALRQVQKARLAPVMPKWIDRADALPDQPLFVVANEFFDALPIRQFQRQGETLWSERRIGLQGDNLQIGLAGAAPVEALAHRLEDTREGDLVEICPSAPAVLAQVSARVAEFRGAALIIDYGDWRSLGDTLQALRRGKSVEVLSHLGKADLTAHVDFEALAAAASPNVHSKLTPQGVFLERLGITARAERLAKNLSGSALEAHIAAHRRLTSPLEMGNLFKVLGIVPRGALPLAGLEL